MKDKSKRGGNKARSPAWTHSPATTSPVSSSGQPSPQVSPKNRKTMGSKHAHQVLGHASAISPVGAGGGGGRRAQGGGSPSSHSMGGGGAAAAAATAGGGFKGTPVVPFSTGGDAPSKERATSEGSESGSEGEDAYEEDFVEYIATVPFLFSLITPHQHAHPCMKRG